MIREKGKGKGDREREHQTRGGLPIHMHVMRSQVDGDDCLEPEGILWIRRT